MFEVRVIVVPEFGASPFNFTAPVELEPPLTEDGVNVTLNIDAGVRVNVAFALVPDTLATSVTLVVMATPSVVAVKVAEVAPDGMLM